MWKNLSQSKQENIIKSAINRMDEFNALCFGDADKDLLEISANGQMNLLDPLERMFKLIIVMCKPPVTDRSELKAYCFEKITEIHKTIGPTNFMWLSIACNLKEAFTLEHFFMNLMIQQLDALYFKTYVINELGTDNEDDKKKLKKKKNKKKKHKQSASNNRRFNSFCEDTDKVEKAGSRSQRASHKTDILSCTVDAEGGIDKMGFDIDIEKNLPFEIFDVKPKKSSDIDKLSDIRENIGIVENTSIKKATTTTPINKGSVFDNAEQPFKAKKNSTFMKKDSKVKEQYNDDSIKITDDKLSSLNNYVLVDEQERKLLIEEKNFGFNSHITIENSDDERLKGVSTHNNDGKFNNLHKSGFNNISKFSEYGYREKKPISCIDKDPFTVEIEKRTSSTDFNKKQDTNQRFRKNEDYNSISINKTISTKAESRRLKCKKDPKNIDMNIPFDLKEINRNNSEVEEEGFCATPIDSKRNQSDTNDDYQKNKSTEHNKKNYYGNTKLGQNTGNNTNKVLTQLSKADPKPNKPKLKKITKDIKQNTEKKISSQTFDRGDPNGKNHKNKPIDKSKKVTNGDGTKNNKANSQISKVEPNASIKAITYWNDDPSPVNSLLPDKHYYESIKSIKIVEGGHESNNDNERASEPKKKEKFKLKKKGTGDDKPDKTLKKQNTSISIPAQPVKNEFKDENLVQTYATPSLSNTDENIKINLEAEQLSTEDTVRRLFNTVIDEQVNSVINNLENYTRSLDEGRRIIQDRITAIIERTFLGENIYVQEYGSYATRLLTPFSDMDLSIQGCIMLDRDQAIEMLQVVCDNLKLFGFVKSAVSILTALVPVVKIEADPSLDFEDGDTTPESFTIKVDIIVDLMDTYNPISTALRTTDYIKYCISTYPSFYKNMLFLKFALNCNDLTNTYKGGLNAYGLCILYVAYIEFFQLEKSTEQFEILHGFLTFLSTQFNPEIQAVYFGTAFR